MKKNENETKMKIFRFSPFKNISMTARRPPSQTNVRPLNNCDAIEWNVNRSQIDCSCDSWFMGQAVHAEKRSKNDASIWKDVSVFTSTNYVTIWSFRLLWSFNIIGFPLLSHWQEKTSILSRISISYCFVGNCVL